MELEGRKAGTREARRILRHQVRKARGKLRHRHPSASDIHAARKEIKKARATLKLLRDALRNPDYTAENGALREAAHPLSEARDSQILVETLDRLLAGHRGGVRIGGARRLRHRLVQERARVYRHATTSAVGVRHVRQLLGSAEKRARRLPVGHHGWSTLGKGVTRLYEEGYRSLQEIYSEPSVERLHAWRKSVKYLSHQLKLLAPLCPRRLGPFVLQLQRLSDHLGDDHDLAVLRQHVASEADAFPDEESEILLITLIDRSRTGLQRKALLLGTELFREDPAHFESRMQGYWRRWHGSNNRPH